MMIGVGAGSAAASADRASVPAAPVARVNDSIDASDSCFKFMTILLQFFAGHHAQLACRRVLQRPCQPIAPSFPAVVSSVAGRTSPPITSEEIFPGGLSCFPGSLRHNPRQTMWAVPGTAGEDDDDERDI